MFRGKYVVKLFTLIELLVVIGILGILASMLLSVLSSGQEKVEATQCSENLKAIGIAFSEYNADNRHIPAPYSKRHSKIPGGKYKDGAQWWNALGSYVGYPNLELGEKPAGNELEAGNIFSCPTAETNEAQGV